jgi:hypothetical protein
MKLFAKGATSGGALAVAVTFVLGCSKPAPTVPTDFGVNITVDAKALSATALQSITVGLLVVSNAETQIKQFPVVPQIASGQLTFRYIPAAGTTGSLDFEFDALDAAGEIWGSGKAGPIKLNETSAVPATITLVTGPGTSKGLGAKCTASSECGSGFCTDNVCCESACTDTCASCALKDTAGLCTGYAAGTDPDKECVGFTMTTGTGTGGGAGKSGAGGAGGAKTDASVPMDASTSDAEAINPPDGGIVAMASTCGGTCNGMKACGFAMSGTSCGTAFCNTRKDVASPVCDGKGSCAISLGDCSGGYACNFGGKPPACRTNCSANADCLTGYYCNGTSNACVPTKTDSLTCQTDAECLHNHCVSGICCNTACASPNTCNDSGSAGTCKCPNVSCNAGVSCAVFYPDVDGDGFGDNKATIDNKSAVAGCADAPPKGYVADDTDCDDKDANAFPGQTAYFSTVSAGTGSFDYDCDGVFEKGLPEYPGAACSFCPDGCTVACSATSSSTCGAANTKASLNCTKSEGVLCSILVLQPSIESTSEISAAVISPPITKLPPVCCGCASSDEAGFTAHVACGQAGTYVTCGACTASMGGVVGTSNSSVKQTCH